MGNDPARRHIVQSLEQSKKFPVRGKVRAPAHEIHRHVDRAHQGHITGDAESRGGDQAAYGTAIAVEQVQQREGDQNKSGAPQRIF